MTLRPRSLPTHAPGIQLAPGKLPMPGLLFSVVPRPVSRPMCFGMTEAGGCLDRILDDGFVIPVHQASHLTCPATARLLCLPRSAAQHCCRDHRSDCAQSARRSQGRLWQPFHRAQNDLRRRTWLRRRAGDSLLPVSRNRSVLSKQVETALDERDEVLGAAARHQVAVANQPLIQPGRAGIEQIVTNARP
jgi:hypothetical protein